MILILAEWNDPHADAVTWYLRHKGAKVLRLNPEEMHGEKYKIICRPDLGSATLAWQGKAYEASAINAVYCRHYNFFRCADNAPLPEHLAISETRSALGGFFRNLDSFWVNNPFNEDVADNKLYQYRQATLQGFKIPKTLVCNDPGSFLEFYRECDGRIIIKQLGEICLLEEEDYINSFGLPDMRAWGFFTQKVRPEHLQYAGELAIAPCLLQEEIEKKSELRVNIVGSQCFAWRIFSQAHPDSQLDFRKVNNLPVEKMELEPNLQDKLVSMARGWGLNFAAIDLIETPDNELVFLEANVCGNWLWLEPGQESCVAEAIANLLLRGK